MPSITVQVSDDDREQIDVVADLLDTDRNTVIREALREGLAEMRLDLAVEQYRAGELSADEAARIAGLNLADWLAIARERNLTPQFTADDRAADDRADAAATASEL